MYVYVGNVGQIFLKKEEKLNKKYISRLNNQAFKRNTDIPLIEKTDYITNNFNKFRSQPISALFI